MVLRYETVEAAEAAYRAAAYKPLLQRRLDATEPTVAFIVETLD